MPADTLNQDFVDLLSALQDHGVEFVVVGAWALAVHGHPRATGDLDVLVRPESGNAQRLLAALTAFGAPVKAHGLTAADFTRPGTVYQLGLPPRRIDLMTSISGVDFDAAWASHLARDLGSRLIPFLGRTELIRNKRASGRAKDLADVERLERET
jgi:hypothetical protein